VCTRCGSIVHGGMLIPHPDMGTWRSRFTASASVVRPPPQSSTDNRYGQPSFLIGLGVHISVLLNSPSPSAVVRTPRGTLVKSTEILPVPLTLTDESCGDIANFKAQSSRYTRNRKGK
jgi:hypothetical protein